MQKLTLHNLLPPKVKVGATWADPSHSFLGFFGHTHGVQKFLGQGYNLSHSRDNARSSTPCASRGTPYRHLFWCSNCPIFGQWEPLQADCFVPFKCLCHSLSVFIPSSPVRCSRLIDMILSHLYLFLYLHILQTSYSHQYFQFQCNPSSFLLFPFLYFKNEKSGSHYPWHSVSLCSPPVFD